MKHDEHAGLLKQLGQKIREVRTEKAIPIKEIAYNIGITTQAYGNIENGKTDLSISRLLEIASELKVHYSKLLDVEKANTFNLNGENSAAGVYCLQMGSNPVYNNLVPENAHVLYEKLLEAKDRELEALRKLVARYEG